MTMLPSSSTLRVAPPAPCVWLAHNAWWLGVEDHEVCRPPGKPPCSPCPRSGSPTCRSGLVVEHQVAVRLHDQLRTYGHHGLPDLERVGGLHHHGVRRLALAITVPEAEGDAVAPLWDGSADTSAARRHWRTVSHVRKRKSLPLSSKACDTSSADTAATTSAAAPMATHSPRRPLRVPPPSGLRTRTVPW